MSAPQKDLLELYGEHGPRWHSRFYIPHFECGAVPQCITFRLADSIPVNLRDAWASELESLSKSEADTERRRRIEKCLDLGLGPTWLIYPEVAQIVQRALLCFDGERYQLHAWVIMPNHVHVLMTPSADLAHILHSWKSFTSKKANSILGRSGAFWQKEYFDRVVRDDRHFKAAITYIENNPVKARLCDKPESWHFSSARWRQN